MSRTTLALLAVILASSPAAAAEVFDQHFDLHVDGVFGEAPLDGALGMGFQYGVFVSPAVSLELQVSVVPLGKSAPTDDDLSGWGEVLVGARHTWPGVGHALFAEALGGFGVVDQERRVGGGLASVRAGAMFRWWDRYSIGGKLGANVCPTTTGDGTIFYATAQLSFEIAF